MEKGPPEGERSCDDPIPEEALISARLRRVEAEAEAEKMRRELGFGVWGEGV